MKGKKKQGIALNTSPVGVCKSVSLSGIFYSFLLHRGGSV